MPDNTGKRSGNLIVADPDALMIGAEMIGHLFLPVGFVERSIGKADTERFEAVARALTNQGGGRGGIESTGQVGANRHIGPQTDFGGIGQSFTDVEGPAIAFFRAVVAVIFIGRHKFGMPVSFDDQFRCFRIQLHRTAVSGRQLAHIGKRRPRRHIDPVVENLAQSRRIDFGSETGPAGQAFDLRSEQQGVLVRGVKQGADSKSIPSHENTATAQIIKDKSKLTIETIDAFVAPSLVGFDDDFSVRVGAERVTESPQLITQFDVIKYFTVEGEPDRTVGIAQGLLTAAQVNDAQPGMTKHHPLVTPRAILVGTAMGERTNHAFGRTGRNVEFAFERKSSADSTHG